MIKGQKRFDVEWDAKSKVQTLIILAVWYARGLFKRLWFKSSKGLVLVGTRVKIRSPHRLKAGRNLVLENNCELNCNSLQGMSFGSNVTIGAHVLIRPSNIYGGQIGEGLTIGDNSNIGPYSYVGCSGLVTIGDNVMISPRVSIYAENHNFDSVDIPMKEQGVIRATVVIESDCWIASNSVILPGVKVGKGSVVAAGSIVTKDVPSYSIVAGNPAKVIKKRK